MKNVEVFVVQLLGLTALCSETGKCLFHLLTGWKLYNIFSATCPLVGTTGLPHSGGMLHINKPRVYRINNSFIQQCVYECKVVWWGCDTETPLLLLMTWPFWPRQPLRLYFWSLKNTFVISLFISVLPRLSLFPLYLSLSLPVCISL